MTDLSESNNINFNGINTKLYFKILTNSEIHNLQPYEQKLITIKTNVKKGDIYIPNIKLTDNVQILSGLYKSNNYQTQTFITNDSDEPQKCITQLTQSSNNKTNN